MPDQTRREIHPCRKMTDGSLRQSCLAQALNEADAVLRPPERRRYPVKIAKASTRELPRASRPSPPARHGKRADSIVKNMLLHSREGSGEHRPADINALADESLNLAYIPRRPASKSKASTSRCSTTSTPLQKWRTSIPRRSRVSCST